MTRNPHSTPARPSREGLFRAAAHVAAVPCGSALALLDLERRTLHAASPDGAVAWAILVEGLETKDHAESDAPGSPTGQSPTIMAWVAGYLLERCLIEPRKGEAGVREARQAT